MNNLHQVHVNLHAYLLVQHPICTHKYCPILFSVIDKISLFCFAFHFLNKLYSTLYNGLNVMCIISCSKSLTIPVHVFCFCIQFITYQHPTIIYLLITTFTTIIQV